MSFLFASSHLPETRVQRPEPSGARQTAKAARRANEVSQHEEEEDEVRPILHSGGVRAFSHLPAKRVAAETAGLLSQRGAQAFGSQFQRTEPSAPGTRAEDGISAAKASGVFDVVRQQYNRGDSPHFMDERYDARHLEKSDDSRY